MGEEHGPLASALNTWHTGEVHDLLALLAGVAGLEEPDWGFAHDTHVEIIKVCEKERQKILFIYKRIMRIL